MSQNMSQKIMNYNVIGCLLVFILSFSACSTFSKIEKSIIKPKAPVAKTFDVTILTTPDINPDINKNPAPIRLDLFQLIENTAFDYAEYLDLMKTGNTLGGKLINQSNYMLQPDKVKTITIKEDPKLQYLGVTAGFREMAQKNWKLTLIKQPLSSSDKSKNYLYLKIDQTGISQLSNTDMQAELKTYAQNHPDAAQVTADGEPTKPAYDYSKGMFKAE